MILIVGLPFDSNNYFQYRISVDVERSWKFFCFSFAILMVLTL